MTGKIKYEFSAKLWKDPNPGGWHFTSLPKDLSKEIRDHLKWQEEGWGRMKIVAEVGNHSWESAIWFDTKSDTYLLPIKSIIRKKAKLMLDDELQIRIWV
jgi:hypothetical protein